MWFSAQFGFFIVRHILQIQYNTTLLHCGYTAIKSFVYDKVCTFFTEQEHACTKLRNKHKMKQGMTNVFKGYVHYGLFEKGRENYGNKNIC